MLPTLLRPQPGFLEGAAGLAGEHVSGSSAELSAGTATPRWRAQPPAASTSGRALPQASSSAGVCQSSHVLFQQSAGHLQRTQLCAPRAGRGDEGDCPTLRGLCGSREEGEHSRVIKGASGGRRRETPPERLQRAVGLQNRRLAPLSGGDGGFLSGICGMIPILAEEERRRAGRHSTVSWLWRATGNGGLWGRSRTGRASGPEGSGWEGRPGAPSLRQVLGHSFCPLGLTFSVPVKKNYYP